MDIKSSLSLLAAIRSGSVGNSPAGAALMAAKSGSGIAAAGNGSVLATDSAGGSFADALGSALQTVSASQNEASASQRDYQLGKGGVTLEQTMIAMQSGQIQFQAAVTVRNRLVSAYSDIMNMPV